MSEKLIIARICEGRRFYFPSVFVTIGVSTQSNDSQLKGYAIANLILNTFDGRIVKLAQGLKIEYTRYVDDLAVSGEDTSTLISAVGKLLSNYGLRIHRAKDLVEPVSAKLFVLQRHNK